MNARITLVIIACSLFFTKEVVSQIACYPLHTGDRWQYTSTMGPRYNGFIVGDTIMPNNKSYKVFENDWDYLLNFQRVNGDTVFFYHEQNNTEYILFNFGAPQPSVTTIITNNDTTDIYLNGPDSSVVLGIKRKSWSCFIDYVRRLIDDESGFIIADSVGITQITSAWNTHNISGALISGKLYGTITGVGEPVYSLPSQFTLGQNYPNPFNPTTNIMYRIEHSGFITLKIYDPVGREANSLVTGIQQPGEYSVSWNATGVPSGVYYYTLTNGTSSLTKTAILLK